jgi:Zn finger protein HypA/HybF involved in hydrogenase expression
MHEVAAMQGVLSTVLERMREAGAERVTHIELTLGTSGHLTEDAARQHVSALAVGTPAEGATLGVTWLPATYQCFSCLHQFESADPAAEATCPNCDGIALEIAHRDACYVSSFEVELPSEAIAVSGRQLHLAPAE